MAEDAPGHKYTKAFDEIYCREHDRWFQCEEEPNFCPLCGDQL